MNEKKYVPLKAAVEHLRPEWGFISMQGIWRALRNGHIKSIKASPGKNGHRFVRVCDLRKYFQSLMMK